MNIKLPEYRVGDWIIVKGKYLVQVAAVHQKKLGYHFTESKLEWTRFDQVLPVILLVSTIRDQRWLVEKEGMFVYQDTEVGQSVILIDARDDKWSVTISDISDGSAANVTLTNIPLFVHQLQHFLKDFKIPKQIVVTKENLGL